MQQGVPLTMALLTAAGKAPVSRRLHSATVMGTEVVIFGGISMEDNSDLNDLCYLTKVILACMGARAGV